MKFFGNISAIPYTYSFDEILRREWLDMTRRKTASHATGTSSIDSDYRHLFSCPEVVRDLLKGYVPGKWLDDVDFSTLVHVNGSYVSESGKQRHDDVVWRVNIAGRWLWIYIITEFQNKPERWMALRMMEYVSQLALQITREIKTNELPEGRIPPILPIVLYNGMQKWNAATDATDCFIEPPGGLEAFLPGVRYLLLDAHRLEMSRSKEIRNFAEAVFRMETNHGKADLFAVIKTLADMLRAPELKSLRRAFNMWIKGLLKRHERDNRITETVNGINDIFEEHDMAKAKYEIFSETIRKNIEAEVRAKVRAEVRAEARAEARKDAEAKYEIWSDTARKEGLKEGEVKLLVRQLSRRFGPLPKWAEIRVNKAKSAQLEKWADAVLDASNLTEVIGAPSRARSRSAVTVNS